MHKLAMGKLSAFVGWRLSQVGEEWRWGRSGEIGLLERTLLALKKFIHAVNATQ